MNPQQSEFLQLRNQISQKLSRITDLASTNSQLTAMVQMQLEKGIQFLTSINGNEQIPILNDKIPVFIPQQREGYIPPQQILYQQYPNYAIQKAIIELTNSANSIEKERIRRRLKGFDPKISEAWRYISCHFGHGVKQHYLCEMAKYLSAKRNIPLDRDAKRRKCVLIKWFHDNWDKISGDMPKFRNDNDELIIEDTDTE
ncbi:hypothetical protein GPJ56_001125 [Histomonas meleagridis]|uniref:uncharacterized protein n=1 Tax=Histomonas meleagridis TaxID=135588 RepID=UPI003559618D|nr:hypothetical protein GPJ56_001125 [Histomonas meleagridis]KAH0798485.1 hypothetical protein GO595_008755 [Histomonas meleagridis]